MVNAVEFFFVVFVVGVVLDLVIDQMLVHDMFIGYVFYGISFEDALVF